MSLNSQELTVRKHSKHYTSLLALNGSFLPGELYDRDSTAQSSRTSRSGQRSTSFNNARTTTTVTTAQTTVTVTTTRTKVVVSEKLARNNYGSRTSGAGSNVMTVSVKKSKQDLGGMGGWVDECYNTAINNARRRAGLTTICRCGRCIGFTSK